MTLTVHTIDDIYEAIMLISALLVIIIFIVIIKE